MRVIVLLFMVILVINCGKKKKSKDPQPDDRVSILQIRYDEVFDMTKTMRDSDNGWISERDCDGALWSGKYGTVDCQGVDITASEFEDQPGRFGRRPPPYCWDPNNGSQGSKTTWSRDMGLGLFSYIWKCKSLDIAERHADYGKKHNWKMGEPFADGRAIYTPSMVGLLYQIIYVLGGENNINRLWPTIYLSGLKGYQAHLQVIQIWLRGEIINSINLPKFSLLSINKTMYKRLQEHVKRLPNMPFYQYVLGIYDGNMGLAIDALLLEGMPEILNDYVRCGTGKGCKYAEWLFVTKLVLDRFSGI